LLKCYKNEISKDIKGVYILHNTSKNKFYVGQSKDIRQRISNQHFKKGYCVNPHFSEDFNNGDKFNISIKECETKDQLDTLEKEYITKFDAFIKGYNKTGGNK
jgi:group I intron endonuclease